MRIPCRCSLIYTKCHILGTGKMIWESVIERLEQQRRNGRNKRNERKVMSRQDRSRSQDWDRVGVGVGIESKSYGMRGVPLTVTGIDSMSNDVLSIGNPVATFIQC